MARRSVGGRSSGTSGSLDQPRIGIAERVRDWRATVIGVDSGGSPDSPGGSSNFETGWLGRVLSGHLGFQIEHHLFPNIPAWRYPEMAPRVRDICERHGLAYATGPLSSQFASAMRRLA